MTVRNCQRAVDGDRRQIAGLNAEEGEEIVRAYWNCRVLNRVPLLEPEPVAPAHHAVNLKSGSSQGDTGMGTKLPIAAPIAMQSATAQSILFTARSFVSQ